MTDIASYLLACTTCMGNPNDPNTVAAGGAVLFMLALLAIVFGGVFQFMRYLCKCERDAIKAAAHGSQD